MNKIFTVLVYSSAHVTNETMVLKLDVPGRDGGTVPVARQWHRARHRAGAGATLCRSWPWHAIYHVTRLYLFGTSAVD